MASRYPLISPTAIVYVDQTDYSLPGLGGGIQIARTWNSQWEG